MIKKIISGGQTGVDQAALDVAIELGIPHGGWMPKGRSTKNAKLPDKYNLKEASAGSYSQPTEINVAHSDGTLVVSREKLTVESALTLKLADQHQKECLHIDLKTTRGFSAAQLIKEWIVINDIKVLNVTGPHASEDPDIYEDTLRLLKAVYQLFFIDSKKSAPANLKPLYPRTVKDAIDRLLAELPFKNKAHLAKLEAHELELLHPTLGEHIVKEYGLRFKKGELIKDCRFMAKDKHLNANDAAVLIIKELWKKLRKTHALRVLK